MSLVCRIPRRTHMVAYPFRDIDLRGAPRLEIFPQVAPPISFDPPLATYKQKNKEHIQEKSWESWWRCPEHAHELQETSCEC